MTDLELKALAKQRIEHSLLKPNEHAIGEYAYCLGYMDGRDSARVSVFTQLATIAGDKHVSEVCEKMAKSIAWNDVSESLPDVGVDVLVKEWKGSYSFKESIISWKNIT